MKNTNEAKSIVLSFARGTLILRTWRLLVVSNQMLEILSTDISHFIQLKSLQAHIHTRIVHFEIHFTAYKMSNIRILNAFAISFIAFIRFINTPKISIPMACKLQIAMYACEDHQDSHQIPWHRRFLFFFNVLHIQLLEKDTKIICA